MINTRSVKEEEKKKPISQIFDDGIIMMIVYLFHPSQWFFLKTFTVQQKGDRIHLYLTVVKGTLDFQQQKQRQKHQIQRQCSFFLLRQRTRRTRTTLPLEWGRPYLHGRSIFSVMHYYVRRLHLRSKDRSVDFWEAVCWWHEYGNACMHEHDHRLTWA